MCHVSEGNLVIVVRPGSKSVRFSHWGVKAETSTSNFASKQATQSLSHETNIPWGRSCDSSFLGSRFVEEWASPGYCSISSRNGGSLKIPEVTFMLCLLVAHLEYTSPKSAITKHQNNLVEVMKTSSECSFFRISISWCHGFSYFSSLMLIREHGCT